jgi:uncharacterized protein YneF (UPF0154 family)
MRDEERDFLIEMNELMIGAMPRPTEDYEQVEQEAWRKMKEDYKKLIEEAPPETKEDIDKIIASMNVKYKAHIAELVEDRGISTESQSKTNEDYQQIAASLKTRYGSYADELATATGRRKILLNLYADVALGMFFLFKSLLDQQQENPGLTPLTVWRTSITAHCMSQATRVFDQISRLDDNMELMHGVKSGEGGKIKASRERAQKMKLIQPLLQELRMVRLSGRYESCEKAVNHFLTNDDRFMDIANKVYGDPPSLSFEKFLMPEAKKTWRDAVKSTPPQKPSEK